MKRLLFRSISVDIILGPVFVAVLLLLLGVDAVAVRGPSMEPVLADGRTVFVNRLAYGLRGPGRMGYIVSWGTPVAGEIVVFRHPSGGHLAVKRCILGPNTPVRVAQNRLHAGKQSFRVTPTVVGQLEGLSRIPEGYLFVVGENRASSSDSRDFGLLPVSAVHGRVGDIWSTAPSRGAS